jgi:hypothetical protein
MRQVKATSYQKALLAVLSQPTHVETPYPSIQRCACTHGRLDARYLVDGCNVEHVDGIRIQSRVALRALAHVSGALVVRQATETPASAERHVGPQSCYGWLCMASQ